MICSLNLIWLLRQLNFLSQTYDYNVIANPHHAAAPPIIHSYFYTDFLIYSISKRRNILTTLLTFAQKESSNSQQEEVIKIPNSVEFKNKKRKRNKEWRRGYRFLTSLPCSTCETKERKSWHLFEILGKSVLIFHWRRIKLPFSFNLKVRHQSLFDKWVLK